MPEKGTATRPVTATSTYAYDTLGRLTSERHPDATGATAYKYDNLGRIRFSQDARQHAAGSSAATRKVTYTVYDAFGRVTRVGEAAADFSGLDPERSYAFENDASSWRSRMTHDGGGPVADGGPNYAQGRLTKVEENTDADAAAEVVHHYAYDHLGSVRVKKVSIDGLTDEKTATYSGDLAGRMTRLAYPGGAQARYAYDGAGRLARVWDARGTDLARYTHTAAGNIDTHVVGDGADSDDGTGDTVGDGIVTGAYTYNPREWITGIDYPGRFTITQEYDDVGNVTGQDYHRAATETPKAATYAYDALHRLTGFDPGAGTTTRSYAYNKNGNITSVTTNGAAVEYRYNRRLVPNRLWSLRKGGTTTTRYAYNENGWATSLGGVAVTYDYRGLATGVGTVTYLMDPDRRRVKKTVGRATTYYVRGADGAVLAEYSGQTLSARYVYAGSRRIARIAGDDASYYLADHLGSTRSLVDGEGTVTAAYDYWPYGKILASSGTGATHFRFTGHERDAESGLDYMLERMYGSNVGRFLRPDPMQDKYPGISPYAYANNNPLKYVDPDGRNHHVPHHYLYAKVASEIRSLKSLAVDTAQETIQTSIVASDAVSEVADYGVLGGLAGAGAGLVTGNPAITTGSLGFVRVSAAIGTGADITKTIALAVDAAFLGGSSQKAIDQAVVTFMNAATSRMLSALSRLHIKPTNFNGPGPRYRHSRSGEFVSDRKGGSYTTATEAARTLVPDDDESKQPLNWEKHQMTRLTRTILGLVFFALCIPWIISNPYGRFKDAGAEYLGDVIDTYGLDSIYTVTVGMNLVMLSYWKDIKNWDKLDFGSKCMIVPAGFFAFICNLWSFFKLIGIMPF